MRSLTLVFFSVFFNFSFYEVGAETLSPPSIFDYFSSDQVVDMTIRADFSKIIHEKIKLDDYQDGVLTFKDKAGKNSVVPVKVKPRGKFRRKVCSFPPLKIKFSKSYLASLGLDTFNTIKLVPQCFPQLENGNDFVLKEYLAYKMFNELTTNSFRVQLLRVTYEDISGGLEKFTGFAFFIEEDEQLAHRMGGSLCKCFNPGPADLNRNQVGMVALFQNMIGNPDWDLTMNRNIETVVKQEDSLQYPVPYDFDFSGLIQPPYLKSADELEGTNSDPRVFKGIQHTTEEIALLKAQFNDKKQAFFQLILNFEYLSKDVKKEMIGFMGGFFSNIDQLPIPTTMDSLPASSGQ